MTRPLILCLSAWWLLTAIAAGQTLTIEVPETSPPYTLIASAATPGFNSYLWTIEGPDRQESDQWCQTSPDCDRIAWTGPPGKYRLTVIVTTPQCKLLKATAAAAIIGGSPPDPPIPSPGELAAVVVVIESSRQTPDQAAVILASAWRVYLTDRKIPFRVIDPDAKDPMDNVPSDLAPSIRAAKNTAGPDVCFLHADADGSVVCEPLPGTAAEMLELVQRYGGGP